MTQETNDVVGRLEARCRRAEDEYPRLAAPDGTVAVPFTDLRALLTDRQSQSARIAELEARQHGGEHGAAGDAIDFALGHLTDERDVVDFLDSWRDETVGIRFPEYTEWLAVQRAGAAEASLTKDSTSG